MSYLKKSLALLLVAVMVLSLAACGKKESANGDTVEKSKLYQETTRELSIGSWYEQYYTSEHDDIYDNPNVADVEVAEMNLKNMRTIEQRYNIRLKYDNLTWNGTIESINTSIMAGAPDCDIYMVDLQFGIPAVLSEYALALEDVLQESDEAQKGLIDSKYLDIFSDEGSDVVQTLKFTSDGKSYLFGGKAKNLGGYALGYNKTLIDNYGLDDPQELELDGKWNWEAWRQMMVAITDDTDGDGNTDQWGFRGAWTVLTTALLMSNGTNIAGIEPDEDGVIREKLTSAATTEVLNFLAQMYQTDKVSFWDADCDSNWNDNVYAFAKGNIGFWISACWITSEADADQTMTDSMRMITWPVGPSGNADTNKNINSTTGTYFMIPTGIENPALVYCVMYDYFNWYDGDLTLRDDDEWFRTWSYDLDEDGDEPTSLNFDYLVAMGDEDKDLGFELWDQVTFDESYQIRGIIETGADAEPITVAEFQQANKNAVQDYLDKNFNK